jgi:hypothetical protein
VWIDDSASSHVVWIHDSASSHAIWICESVSSHAVWIGVSTYSFAVRIDGCRLRLHVSLIEVNLEILGEDFCSLLTF